MEEFVRESIGAEKKEEDGDAQSLGKTEEDDSGTDGPLGEESTKEKNDRLAEGEEAKDDKKEEAKKGDEEKKDEAKKEGDEGEEAKKDGEEEKVADEEKKKDPIPYERFEEVNTKLKTTEAEMERIKPIAEHHEKIVEYCDKYNITPDQFSKVLEIQALLNTNPEEALKRILPIVEQVQGFTGDKLPQDIQKEVDEGTLTLNRARELASLRAKQQFGTNRFDQYQRKQQSEQQANLQQGMTAAMQSWTSAKQGSNPDFKPKVNDADPDGVYEFVTDRFVSLMNKRDKNQNFENLVRTPQELTALLEKAYGQVVRSLAPLKKPATRPVLNSREGGKSGGKTFRIEDAKSMKEVVVAAAEGRI